MSQRKGGLLRNRAEDPNARHGRLYSSNRFNTEDGKQNNQARSNRGITKVGATQAENGVKKKN